MVSPLKRIYYDIARKNSELIFKQIGKCFNDNSESKIHWGLWFDLNDRYGKNKWWNHVQDKNKRSFFTNYRMFNKDNVFSNTFTKNSGMDD